MNILVTAGPTREHIDPVRFITNGSSGRMGYALAAAAAEAGHRVTLLTGPVALAPPEGVTVVPFVTVAELAAAMEEHFDACDALMMTAAVGDFTVAERSATKLRRSAGPVTMTLTPTEDLLAGVAARRREGQILIGFAVEDTHPQATARAEMAGKGVDYVVVNTPAAMAAADSEAAILAPDHVVLKWEMRSKETLAKEILALLEARPKGRR